MLDFNFLICIHVLGAYVRIAYSLIVRVNFNGVILCKYLYLYTMKIRLCKGKVLEIVMVLFVYDLILFLEENALKL